MTRCAALWTPEGCLGHYFTDLYMLNDIYVIGLAVL